MDIVSRDIKSQFVVGPGPDAASLKSGAGLVRAEVALWRHFQQSTPVLPAGTGPTAGQLCRAS